MRHGKGIMKFADGRQYRGKWRLDQVPAPSHASRERPLSHFASARRLLTAGAWCHLQPHGQGEEVKTDRTTYKGEYHHGLWNGQGVETTVYGDEYSGEWHRGERHGKVRRCINVSCHDAGA